MLCLADVRRLNRAPMKTLDLNAIKNYVLARNSDWQQRAPRCGSAGVHRRWCGGAAVVRWWFGGGSEVVRGGGAEVVRRWFGEEFRAGLN